MSRIDYDEHRKTMRFQPLTRFGVRDTFDVELTARLDGYFVNITQREAGGGKRLVALRHAPRYTLHAGQFFRDREHYRGELIGEIMAELRHGAYDPIDMATLPPGVELPEFDCYIRANLDPRVWPDGYPDAKDDDLANWRKGLSLEEQPK
ncbi:hypothetical protein WQE_47709 [Paraburkholderia hospita]|uniref:CYTH domain-containing protein n=1 Tax=Paraburkholderia hospita TaxID=169430 RepID=A0ABP2P8E1_9BURK|nr:hypothetical protein [Paraburkholderia hospita]EIM93895.1 hypothetical protein WQE_47709 [Paraburkholderia hospita]OUL92580.1 hypothetical protein CA602_02870 [Paraburkholderia hospita]